MINRKGEKQKVVIPEEKNKIVIPGERKVKFYEYYIDICDKSKEAQPEMLRDFKRAKSEIEKQYIVANIPKKYYDFTLESVETEFVTTTTNERSFACLKQYISEIDKFVAGGNGLYISGPSGTAKTTMAVIILKEAIKLNYRCYFLNARNMVKLIRAGWKNNFVTDFFDYIVKNADFLVIDEFGKMDKSFDSEIQEISDVFSNRDYENLITIITSNYNSENGEEIFGTCLHSKFKGLAHLNFTGKDYRDNISDNIWGNN